MLIQLVHQNAERKLLDHVEGSHGLRGALHFQCSKTSVQPSEEDVLLTVKPVLEERNAAIYFLQDDDLVITWNGTQKSVVETLCDRLYRRFNLSTDNPLHTYYDFNAQGEELRLLCKHKMAAMPSDSNIPAEPTPAMETPTLTLSNPSPKQLSAFKRKQQERSQRKIAEILVVEDQLFSRKLLIGLLEKTYKTYAAADANAAFGLYLEHAPDIIMLDIELPGINGHLLAAAIRALDPEVTIVMVTANHYAKDVAQAKKNGANGFIAKPYSKQKILNSIEQLLYKRTGK